MDFSQSNRIEARRGLDLSLGSVYTGFHVWNESKEWRRSKGGRVVTSRRSAVGSIGRLRSPRTEATMGTRPICGQWRPDFPRLSDNRRLSAGAHVNHGTNLLL